MALPYHPNLPPRPGPVGPPTSGPRPSGWWFVVGAALVLAALVLGVLLLWRTVSTFSEVEAAVPADGAVHEVEVGTDGDRFLWAREGQAAACTVVDTTTGAERPLGPVMGTFTRSGGSGSWVAVGRFEPGSGDLEVTCAPSQGPAEIGPAVAIGSFVGSIALTVGLPLLLGGTGLVVLVVTGVLWATRPARRTGPGPSWSPGRG